MITTAFIPRPYQRIAGRFMLTHPRCALWLSCGLGKTSTTLMALQYLFDTHQIKRAVVFAPLRVAQTSWPEEVQKWGLGISVISCTGTLKSRENALAANPNVLCINYEQAEWLVSKQISFDAVVIDEASRIKSYRRRGGGKRAHVIGKLCKDAKIVWELTGTPSSRSLEDLYGQITLLDDGERLGRSMTAFRQKYFLPIRVGKDAFCVRWEPMASSQELIHACIKDIVCAIRTEDYFPVDKPLFLERKVQLLSKARKVYDKMEKEMFTEIQEHPVEAVSAGSKVTKCMQIADGFLYDNDQIFDVHDEKILALQSIIEESQSEPICVCYWFKADLRRLKKAFPQAEELTSANLPKWNAGQIPLLLMHPASAGHGLNLQDGGCRMVFIGHGWSLELRDQAIERLGPTRQKQSGHPRPVYIYDIIAERTIDELVMKRYVSKKSVQDTLLEACSNRGILGSSKH